MQHAFTFVYASHHYKLSFLICDALGDGYNVCYFDIFENSFISVEQTQDVHVCLMREWSGGT